MFAIRIMLLPTVVGLIGSLAACTGDESRTDTTASTIVATPQKSNDPTATATSRPVGVTAAISVTVTAVPKPSPTGLPRPSATAVSVSPTPTEDPTAPTHTPDAATPTATVEPVVFVFANDVGDLDRQLIGDAIEMAANFMDAVLGGRIREQVVVRVGPHPVCGTGRNFFGSDGLVYLNVGHEQWHMQTEYQRAKTIAHEYFHNLQTELGCRFEPVWLAEGSAEFFGYQVVVANGLTDYETARQFNYQNVANGEPLPALADTSHQTEGARYGLWFLAVEQLLGESSLMPLRQFCEVAGQGGSWQEAFAQAFSLTPDQFYSSFASFRTDNGF